MRLAVIGAGVAGLAAAHWLRREQPQLELVVYEQGSEPGGRAVTRRLHGAVFDHGAQYVRTPTPALEQLLCQTLGHETLVDVNRPVWCFDAGGSIVEGDPAQNADPKWTYRDGLGRLALELARGVDLRLGARVAELQCLDGAFRLLDSHGALLCVADAALLTPPAPQTAELIAASALPPATRESVVEVLARVSYRRCLSITLAYSPILEPRPWYALVNPDRRHPISWLAYEHLKPGRATNGQHLVIAQMAPGWSLEQWDEPLSAVAAQVSELLSVLLGEDLREPHWADLQAWPHALPDGEADFELLNGALPGLFFAGDFTAGQGRVHLAIEQGWQAARRIADFVAHCSR